MHDVPSLASFLSRHFADLSPRVEDTPDNSCNMLTAEVLHGILLRAESAVVRELTTAEGDTQLALCELACRIAGHQGIDCTPLQQYCEELAKTSGAVAFKCTDLADDVICGETCDFDLALSRSVYLAENALPSGESLMVYDNDHGEEFSATLYAIQLAPRASPQGLDTTMCCVTGCGARFEGPNYTRRPHGYNYVPKAPRYKNDY